MAILLYEQYLLLTYKDHVTPQHTAFEQSAACLSIVVSYFLVLYGLQYWYTLGELQNILRSGLILSDIFNALSPSETAKRNW